MSRVKNYKKITESFIILSVILLVFFYDFFNQYLGFFDEFLALIFSLVILSNLLLKSKIRLYKQEIYNALLLFFIFIIGLTSNYFTYKANYITQNAAIIGDLISFFKAYIVYFGLRFISNSIDSKRIIDRLSKYFEILFYLLVIFLVVDFFFKIFPQYQRFGLTSFQLFFTHTSRYGFAFAFIFIVLFPKYYKRNNLFLLFILSLGLLSLRVKFFGYFILSVLFIYSGKTLFRIPRKTFLIVLTLLIISVGLLFKSQFEMYFDSTKLDSGWSRAIVLFYSFRIGNDFFPLGTGFGTYSSYFSGKYYSWVYGLYGIDKVYGISKEYWEFISDQFWPMILGQFGFFGLFSFAGVIYNYFMLFLKQIRDFSFKSNYRYIPLLGLILLLIDSSSDAVFTQNRAVAMFIIFALVINIKENKNGKDK